MQAIVTKWLPCTNTKPNRIKASCPAGSLTMSSDHGHRHVAEKLVEKLGWTHANYGTLVSGSLSDGSEVHVMTCRDGKGDY